MCEILDVGTRLYYNDLNPELKVFVRQTVTISLLSLQQDSCIMLGSSFTSAKLFHCIDLPATGVLLIILSCRILIGTYKDFIFHRLQAFSGIKQLKVHWVFLRCAEY